MAARDRTSLVWGALALGLVLASCGTNSEDPMPRPSPTTHVIPSPTKPLPAESVPPITMAPVSPQPVPDEVLARSDVHDAIADEAARRGVEPDSVTVVAYESVTWPDGSLGCPEPGKAYTQALVPGRRLVLSVDGEQASYHAGTTGAFFHCAAPRPALPADDAPGR